jgi:hypothetical protein
MGTSYLNPSEDETWDLSEMGGTVEFNDGSNTRGDIIETNSGNNKNDNKYDSIRKYHQRKFDYQDISTKKRGDDKTGKTSSGGGSNMGGEGSNSSPVQL